MARRVKRVKRNKFGPRNLPKMGRGLSARAPKMLSRRQGWGRGK